MQTPMGVSGIQPKISVWLDNSNPTELKQFHCSVCGKVVFEYYSDAKIMMAGEMGDAKKSPIVIQCHGRLQTVANGEDVNAFCKAKYWIE